MQSQSAEAIHGWGVSEILPISEQMCEMVLTLRIFLGEANVQIAPNVDLICKISGARSARAPDNPSPASDRTLEVQHSTSQLGYN